MNSISNVKDLIEKVNEQKQINLNSGERSDLIFRGQNLGYRLEPKLIRYARGDATGLEKLVNRENLVMREFERLSPPLLSIEPKSELDLVVLAQHFGLPTRLLDWTYNPLSALWFGINMVRTKGRESGDKASVWIFRPSLADYQKQQNWKGSIYELDCSMVYRPRNLTSRIVNQSSIFVVHHMNSVTPLEGDVDFSEKLVQYEVNPANEDKILRELHVLNINESTIYPDLNGLCSHLKWRYFEMTD